ncbi:hypothetical protein HYV81_00600 [Candidatus Woesearchaeota archaeon]|nr:hypothetical protein [Candidatus Woesearchaeota archaeon]
MKFLIEHLEPKLYRWCLLEYKHISERVGKKNVIFTNVNARDKAKLSKFGEVYTKKVAKLELEKTCILDPYAKEKLKPADARKSGYFIFGGILGNNPAEGRTKKLTEQMPKAARRNLGKRQLSTDTAVIVAKLILTGIPFEKIQFQDELEIETGEDESVVLPYPYVVKDGKAVVSKELVAYLKRKKGF